MRIIYLDIDSLRPDHLGCYGYSRNTSPNIDLLAQEGQRFNRVYTSDAPCLPSRTALYTGRFGFHTGVVSHGGSAADPWPDGRTRGTRDRIDGYHLFPTEMLFDLESDPHEQFNIAGEQPGLCDRGLRLLTEWSEEMLRGSPRNQDPMWTVIKEHGLIYNRGQLPAYCDRLQATGRGWAVPELKRRHPHEFTDSL